MLFGSAEFTEKENCSLQPRAAPKTKTFPPKKLDASKADFGTGWEVRVTVVLVVPDVVTVVGAEEGKAGRQNCGLELIGDGWQWAQDRIQHLAVTDVELSQQ